MLVVVALVSLLAAGLTFFSGFGLGTVLTPVFALFFPVGVAVAATAIVHLANNLTKLLLTGRHAHLPTVLRFGLPAMAAAAGGAWLLERLGTLAPWQWQIGDWSMQTTPLKLLIGALIVGFSLLELWPRFQALSFESRWLPAGGVLSGFFGGLSGHQGAFRSAFLIKCGLDKEAFIATGVIIAVLVDTIRLVMYGFGWSTLMQGHALPVSAVAVGVVSAAAGSILGSRLLKKMTLARLQQVVGILLALLGMLLAGGLI